VRALGLFVLAPLPGRVKPALAADVGPSAAAEVAGQLARRVVAATVGTGFRTVVFFAPADERAFVRESLEGLGRLELRPQPRGRWGQRLESVAARLLREGAHRVVLARTDYPGVTRRLVMDAFAALDEVPLVLGPGLEGGLYLVALRPPAGAVLQSVADGGPASAARLRARAAALGLRFRVLRPLRGVIEGWDARLAGLLNS
jgi:hypothetical protein